MTRKDYVNLAEIMKDVKTDFIDKKTGDINYDSGKYDGWWLTINRLANTLHDQNPRFDRLKFLKDCGMEDTEM